MTTMLGLLAGILTTGCWLPQLVRSWRTRSTKDISWSYLAVLSTGVGLWTLYGVIIADPAVVLTNAATAIALLTLAALKSAFEGCPSKSGSADAR